MYCQSCGSTIDQNARFCQSCGKPQLPAPSPSTPVSTVNISQASPQAARPKKETQSRIFWLIMGGIILVAVAGEIGKSPKSPSNDPNASPASSPQETPSPVVKENVTATPEPPVDPTVQKAAQKQLREEWVKGTQEEMWRQGYEMKVQAHGTTLYVEYILAGDAFAFQFRDGFLRDSTQTLRTLGFKRIQLSNGDKIWSWTLAN